MEQINPLSWLFTRRSIRKYSERTIAESDIDTILRAGMYAPPAVSMEKIQCYRWSNQREK